MPDPERRALALSTITMVAVTEAVRFGHVFAARRNGRLQGVAVWVPPRHYPMRMTRRLRAIPAMARLATRMPRDFRNVARLGAAIDAVFPDEPVWYLQVLGVHPDAQRRGLGSRLLIPTLKNAHRTGIPCYLETSLPANVGYYQRFGFDLITAAGSVYPGGPELARMSTAVNGRT